MTIKFIYLVPDIHVCSVYDVFLYTCAFVNLAVWKPSDFHIQQSQINGDSHLGE